MNIYYYEYYDPDLEDHNEPITAYFVAASEQDADEQFERYSQFVSNLELNDSGSYTVDEIEDLGLTDAIVRFTFATDDDNLLMAVLNIYPSKALSVIEDLLFSYEMPKCFAHVLSVLPDTEVPSQWLQMMVGHKNVNYTNILVARGVKDESGLALARACMHGNRELFDILYPISNPLEALNVDILRRREWIEERMAQEQKQLLSHEVAHVASPPLKTKKL